jgi:hypothetical protein
MVVAATRLYAGGCHNHPKLMRSPGVRVEVQLEGIPDGLLTIS